MDLGQILVVFGYPVNNHGRNWLILVIFSLFGVAIVCLSLHIDKHSICDDKSTIAFPK